MALHQLLTKINDESVINDIDQHKVNRVAQSTYIPRFTQVIFVDSYKIQQIRFDN